MACSCERYSDCCQAAMLTTNQAVALVWAVACVIFQSSDLRAASLKRRKAAEDLEDARAIEYILCNHRPPSCPAIVLICQPQLS